MAIKILPNALLLALLSFANTVQAQDSPRVYINDIAAMIEEHYFDQARAKEIATKLRKAAAKGRFDSYKNKLELSTELSTWLDPYDTHFDVSWSAPEPATAVKQALPMPATDSAMPDPQKRGNYGVRKAEVLPGNIGYLNLRSFAGFEFGEANQPARIAMDAGLQLLSSTNALIIDLRDNGGGAPQMVGYLSSAFVKKDADIFNTFHGRGRTMSEAPMDWHPQPRLETPIYILISARTASAAEAFAYTMQSAKRAIVVGETSMGAANPGAALDAGNGFKIFISFASPVNPITKANWEDRGVIPNVEVAATDALNTAKELALKAAQNSKLQGSDATEVNWALDALMAETNTPKALPTADYVGQYGALMLSVNNGRLIFKSGRRPSRTLLPLGEDRFAVQEDPSIRMIFERDASGRILALESQTVYGDSTRYRRNEP